MDDKHFYAGIGSRTTPESVLVCLKQIAKRLSKLDFILRSGDAVGADKAFETAAKQNEIFYAHDAKDWAFKEAAKHLPNDRSNYENWRPYVQGLIARNMQQILGKEGTTPVDFVICWTKSTNYTDSSSGGTGYAIRCALSYNIAVYNLFSPHDAQKFYLLLSEMESLRQEPMVPKNGHKQEIIRLFNTNHHLSRL